MLLSLFCKGTVCSHWNNSIKCLVSEGVEKELDHSVKPISCEGQVDPRSRLQHHKLDFIPRNN